MYRMKHDYEKLTSGDINLTFRNQHEINMNSERGFTLPINLEIIHLLNKF